MGRITRKILKTVGVIATVVSLSAWGPIPEQCGPDPGPAPSPPAPSCGGGVHDRRTTPNIGYMTCGGGTGDIQLELLCQTAPVYSSTPFVQVWEESYWVSFTWGGPDRTLGWYCPTWAPFIVDVYYEAR